MARENQISDSAVLTALAAFAVAHMKDGGSLRMSHYTDWKAAPMSGSTIIRRLGQPKWETAILSERDRLLVSAPDPDAVVELPVECAHSGITWCQLRVVDWAVATCSCRFCVAPAIAEKYPELLFRLCDAGDASKTTEHWVAWNCPSFTGHKPRWSPAVQLVTGERSCQDCENIEKWYATHEPGDLCRRADRATAPVDHQFIEHLRALLPDERIDTGQAVVVGRRDERIIGRAITPHAVLGDRRIAIEVEEANRPAQADAAIHLAAARDRALAAVGWATIRVRRPNALPLPPSPAVIAVAGRPDRAGALVSEEVSRLIAERVDTPPARKASALAGKRPVTKAPLSDDERAAQRLLVYVIHRRGSIIATDYWACYRDINDPAWLRTPREIHDCLDTLQIPHVIIPTSNPFKKAKKAGGGVEIRVARADFPKVLRWAPSFQKMIGWHERLNPDVDLSE